MTKLHMERLFHQPNKNYERHNRLFAYHILHQDVYQDAPNTLVVLHGPQQSGKSSISKRLLATVTSSTDEYLKKIRTTTCTEKHFVNSFIYKYDEEPLLIVVQDSVDLHDIQYYSDLLNSYNGKNQPPITIVLELKTP